MQEFKFKKVFNSIGIRGDNVYISFFNEDGVTLFEYHGGHIPKAKTFSPTKAKGKLFLHNYGITPRALIKIIEGVVMEKVISPHPHWDKLTYSRRNWTKPYHEVQLIEMEDVFKQCYEDGIENIIPVVAAFRKTPTELKKFLKPALWKSLCKNTYSRNRLIMHTLRVRNPLYPDETVILHLEELVGVPSSMLRYVEKYYPGCGITPQHVKDLKKKYAVPYTKLDNLLFQRDMQIVLDTKRLIPNTFNPKWSFRRIKEEHDKFIQELNRNETLRKEAYDEEMKILAQVDISTLHSNLSEIQCVNSVKITPLLSMQEVREEGKKMHHCVGGYAASCARGEYLVFSLTKGEDEATLGISVRDGKYTFNQMYHKYNKVVEDKDFFSTSDAIIKTLNKR